MIEKRWNIIKKIISFCLLIAVFTSCVSMPLPKKEVLTKDSEPYYNYGTPLYGSYQNKQYIKSGIYIASTVLSLIGALLFAPLQEGNKGIIPIDDSIGTPLSLSLLGVGFSTALIISPIDTAISYNLRNQKIMDLNSIEWKPGTGVMKHQAIINHRKQIKLDQIDNYRRKFAMDTITTAEIYIIGSDEEMNEALEIELEGYMKRRKVEKEKEANESVKSENE